jgi:hypothetical protein
VMTMIGTRHILLGRFGFGGGAGVRLGHGRLLNSSHRITKQQGRGGPAAFKLEMTSYESSRVESR